MLKLNELKKNIHLLNTVEWDLNPAVAVGRHLEWGAGWAADKYRARGSADESVYFTINTWEKIPYIVLVKRNGFDMEEMARFRMPLELEKKFLDSIGYHKGIYELDTEIKNWLRTTLNSH
ncbi:MAG: hypothetical protein KKD44_19985 [Proteobacteria bacterium]|nr:hypothetical protein [Pseudomonadota bacterium]